MLFPSIEWLRHLMHSQFPKAHICALEAEKSAKPLSTQSTRALDVVRFVAWFIAQLHYFRLSGVCRSRKMFVRPAIWTCAAAFHYHKTSAHSLATCWLISCQTSFELSFLSFRLMRTPLRCVPKPEFACVVTHFQIFAFAHLFMSDKLKLIPVQRRRKTFEIFDVAI